LGVSAAGQPPAQRKKKLAKTSPGNTLDRCNLRRHKLRKRTIRLGTLNVQGIKKNRRNYKGFGRTKTRHYDINKNEEKSKWSRNNRTLLTLL